MKIAVDKKYIDLEIVESELTNLRRLLELLADYFMHSKEYVTEHPNALTARYIQHGALNWACIVAVDGYTRAIEHSARESTE